MNNDLECPYCDAPNEVCHDDGEGYDEDVAHEMTCGSCQKNFVFHTSIIYRYSPERADCLNGAPHRFSQWRKLWLDSKHNEIQDRRCRDCGHEERRTVPLQHPFPATKTP